LSSFERWPLLEGARRHMGGYLHRHNSSTVSATTDAHSATGREREGKKGQEGQEGQEGQDVRMLEFFDYTTKRYYLWDTERGRLAKKFGFRENCCTESKQARRNRRRKAVAATVLEGAAVGKTGSAGSAGSAEGSTTVDRCRALLLGLPMPTANPATGIPFKRCHS
jgi:hypothetical protein